MRILSFPASSREFFELAVMADQRIRRTIMAQLGLCFAFEFAQHAEGPGQRIARSQYLRAAALPASRFIDEDRRGAWRDAGSRGEFYCRADDAGGRHDPLCRRARS